MPVTKPKAGEWPAGKFSTVPSISKIARVLDPWTFKLYLICIDRPSDWVFHRSWMREAMRVGDGPAGSQGKLTQALERLEELGLLTRFRRERRREEDVLV